MSRKPTYAELEARVRELEAAAESASFQQLADFSPDALYLFDIESGTFPFCNQRFLGLYETEEKRGKTVSSHSAAQHIHPEDGEKLWAARALSLKADCTQGEVEYRYINPDGTTRWMHDRWSVVRDSQNRAVAIGGVIRDNTQKKQAEDELERSRNSALIGCYILQGGRLIYVNPEFCRITAYAEEELIGMPSLNLVHVDYRDHVRENALRMLAGQRTAPYEFCIVDSTGRLKWAMETVASVIYEGRRAALGYLKDITKRKQVDGERRGNEKLKTALEMAGAVSHEFSSPLQAVLTAIEKLGADNLVESRKEGLIVLVRKNALRLAELSLKIQRISQHAARDYADGAKIIDSDRTAEP